MLVITIYVNSG